MIITLTGNLLAERTLTFAQWNSGKTQRAQSESFQVGGKGINVTKMLARIGCATTAWCFPGGASGAECADWLQSRGMPHRAFVSTSATRTGVVIRSAGVRETTFLAPDRAPDAGALRACAHAIESERRTHPETRFALCGSFPGWATDEAQPLRGALAACARDGALVVDSYGPPLAWALGLPTALIKINRDEFDPLFAEADRSRSVHERLSVALQRWPVRQWIVTDGPHEVCYGGVDTKPTAVAPPKVEEVSPTGSGDVLLACVLAGLYQRKLTLSKAVEYALPYAAANAAHPGVAEFDLNNLPLTRSLQP